MKQLLFMLISILIGLNTLLAQETNPIEETTWNVIRERLFGENNSKAFRFEDDIRIELKGEVTERDSLIVENLITELNPLLETVDIKLVEEDANFVIEFLPSKSGISQKTNYHRDGTKITYTHLWFSFNEGTSIEKIEKEIRYYVVRHLTRIFDSKVGTTFYGGIFDQPFPQIMPLHEIDKDLLSKLYSKDFYKNLRKNTTKKWGYLSYLNLRYNNLITNLFLSIKIILIIFGFLYFLSKESKRVKHPTLWVYIKQRTIIFLIIPFIFSFISKTGNFPTPIIPSLGIFVANFLGTVIYALFAILLLFYIERFVFKRITDFWRQQLFIFFNTFLAVVLVYSFVSIPFIFLNNSQSFRSLGFALLLNTPILLFVISVATLRVFYNFINYRLQSMVNQKDVELAKMKELKNQAELNALHSRINPHFLYNSLNSIASLAHINPDKTENMATALSELFRYSINKENKTFVTVEEELEMVKKYLEIEKTRFEDKLEYQIEAEENVKEILIPKFLIQPLAENAIKHGLSKIKEIGKIIVEVKRLEKDLVITIFDNGPDFPEEPVSGYGLQNLNDKLEIIYGSDAFINWENGNNKHFKITIKNQFKG